MFRKSLESSQKAPVAKSYFSKVEGFYRSSYRRCSVKSGVFRKRFAQNSQENTCVRDYFIKVAGLKLWKKTLTQVFSCEFSEISKNSFCKEYLRTTASAFSFSEAATGSVLWKKVILKISQNSQENTLFFEIFKNTFFTEHPWTTASGFFVQRY